MNISIIILLVFIGLLGFWAPDTLIITTPAFLIIVSVLFINTSSSTVDKIGMKENEVILANQYKRWAILSLFFVPPILSLLLSIASAVTSFLKYGKIPTLIEFFVGPVFLSLYHFACAEKYIQLVLLLLFWIAIVLFIKCLKHPNQSNFLNFIFLWIFFFVFPFLLMITGIGSILYCGP